jgi:mRNA-degrading endonuclease RelE of RelBE toxin-antitoxin system
MYKIFWKNSALKETKKVPKDVRIKIFDVIESLKNDPRPLNSKKNEKI